MRPLAALAPLLLLASTARAEEPAATPSPPQLSLVEVFDTQQALVFDRIERQYLVVSTGSAVQGFRVESVTSQQLELVDPALPGRHYIVTLPVSRAKAAPAAPIAAAPIATPKSLPEAEPATAPAPATPAPPAPALSAPQPSPEPATVPETGDAPIDPYADAIKLPTREIKVVRAPPASRPKAPAPATAPTPEPAPSGPAVLSRAQLDDALSNLESLSAEIELSLGRGGVVIDAVRPGSLGHRLGLRAGDVIHSVAGVPTRKLEDGADVYVRLGQVKRFDIELSRAGKKLALPVVIK